MSLACTAVSPLTRDVPIAEIEAALAAEEACEQAAQNDEVEAIPEAEIIVPEIEIQVPEVEACAADDVYPEGYDATNIIF